MSTPTTKFSVGISSCLLGEEVRYDGGHRQNSFIKYKLAEIFDFVPFCPEVAIGLGVPRDPLQLVNKENRIRCLGVKDEKIDVTDPLINYAQTINNSHTQLCGYIFKRGSPSCGIKNVKTFNFDQKDPDSFKATGVGIYARQVMLNQPLLPVADEDDMDDVLMRENFIQRVRLLHNWFQLLNEGLTVRKLKAFHSRLVINLIKQSQKQSQGLDKLLANIDKNNIEKTGYEYIQGVMKILT